MSAFKWGREREREAKPNRRECREKEREFELCGERENQGKLIRTVGPGKVDAGLLQSLSLSFSLFFRNAKQYLLSHLVILISN